MTLLLHTSTPTVRVGLADGGRVVADEKFPASRDLASTLADRIREFLHAQCYTLKDLEKIVVHSGPGGFTSLRIGVTTANALAYALRIPVIGVTGDIPNPQALFEASKTVQPAAAGTVVPTYSVPPDIGPVPRA